MKEVHRIGFTKLGADDARNERYRFNVIFVHGLKGHPKHTWGKDTDEQDETEHTSISSPRKVWKLPLRRQRPDSSTSNEDASGDASSPQPFWPEEFLTQDIPEARVWTYGFNADVLKGLFEASNKNSVSQHGRDLEVRLGRDIDNEDPIIFIAHSLGGIIIKDAIRRSESCQSRTKLIIFLGTPHRGSAYAGWGGTASNLARLAFQDPNKKILTGLELNSEVLDNIQEEFKTIAYRFSIKVHSFQEARGPSGIKGLDGKVVDDFSSKVDLPRALETVETIDADHRSMVKCINRSDDRYRIVVGVLLQFMRSGSLNTVNAPSPQHAASSHHDITRHEAAELATNRTYFYVPFPVNRRFIGRIEIIETLTTMLFKQNTSTSALVGLGGIGKTQVALQVAFWAKENMPEYSVFWVAAMSNASFEQACNEITRTTGIKRTDDESAKESVQRYLSSKRSGKWLLIVDNADDMDILFESSDESGPIHNYLPRSDEGQIMFTTRSRKLAVAVANNNIVELREMTQDEGAIFLQKSLSQTMAIDDETVANSLLRELTYLPLAITQAAAYMNENQIPITAYLELLRNTDQDMVELLSADFKDSTRYKESQNAVATTWLISFTQVCSQDKSAAKILTFIASLEPKAIPLSMLPPVGSKQEMTRALGTLCGYGFLSRRESSEIFDMHSLVHLVTRLWTQQDSSPGQELYVIQHLEHIFPLHAWEDREIWRQYLPHALKVLKAQQKGAQDESISHLSVRVGQCLLADGRIEEAVNLLRQAVITSEKVLAENHPYRLASQHVLAGAYHDNGQVKEAVKLLKHVVEIRKKSLAEGHPDRLISQSDLAGAYRANGQVKEAIKLQEYVVEICRKTLAEDHPSRLSSQHTLAGAYHANGQVKEAVKLQEHVVEICRKILAEDHPYRLVSQHTLAEAYHDNGKVKEAVKLLEYVVEIREKALAEGHPDRLSSQHALARAYQANGQVKEAVKLLEHVVEICRKILAEGHPYRLASQHTLAVAYQANGQVKEAVKLQEYVVEIREKALAEDHPSRLSSQNALAGAYQANGQVKEAVKLLEYVVEIREKALAVDHPNRLASQHALARAYQANGQAKEAVKLLEYVVEIREKALAEGHPSQLASQHALARAYQANGQVKEAVKLLEYVVVREKALAEDHPSRLASQHTLAEAYQADGQVKEAVKLLEYVVEIREKALADDHPDQIASRRLLTQALSKFS